jgi:hypothetical protein
MADREREDVYSVDEDGIRFLQLKMEISRIQSA